LPVRPGDILIQVSKTKFREPRRSEKVTSLMIPVLRAANPDDFCLIPDPKFQIGQIQAYTIFKI
jgi:hypothetical protein